MNHIKSNKLKQKRIREEGEILTLAGYDGPGKTMLLRKYARRLQETGAIPEHVLMFRKDIEETEVPEPDTRLQPKVVVPTDEERAKLEEKWR